MPPQAPPAGGAGQPPELLKDILDQVRADLFTAVKGYLDPQFQALGLGSNAGKRQRTGTAAGSEDPDGMPVDGEPTPRAD